MAIQTTPILVAAPAFAQRYGLFTVASMENLPVHARQGGVRYTTPNCTLPDGYEPECGSAQNAKDFADSNRKTTVTGAPFVVYATEVCGPVGYTEAEHQAQTVEKLKNGEQAAVESIISSGGAAGAFGASPTINLGATMVAGPSTYIPDAVGQLESLFYATFGHLGVMHISPRVSAHFVDHHLLWRDGLYWRTAIGTLVSIGNYAGLTNAGAAPAAGTENIYMTGPITVRRTSDEDLFVAPMSGALDRTTNEVFMIAEREYVVDHPCTPVGTLLTLKTTP